MRVVNGSQLGLVLPALPRKSRYACLAGCRSGAQSASGSPVNTRIPTSKPLKRMGTDDGQLEYTNADAEVPVRWSWNIVLEGRMPPIMLHSMPNGYHPAIAANSFTFLATSCEP